jgi:hypothetical protein
MEGVQNTIRGLAPSERAVSEEYVMVLKAAGWTIVIISKVDLISELTIVFYG